MVISKYISVLLNMNLFYYYKMNAYSSSLISYKILCPSIQHVHKILVNN